MKKKRIRNAVRIFHCEGRKLTRIALTIFACLAATTSCTTKVHTPHIVVEYEPCDVTAEQPDTWELYCSRHHITDKHCPTVWQYNDYLDAYKGSVEEEKDLETFKKAKI